MASKTPIGSVAGTAAVEFSNVSFSYNEKAKEVLSNITFKAMSGQTIELSVELVPENQALSI